MSPKGEFDWTLTDFLNLCVSTPEQMRCSFNGKRERERSNAPVHINFWVTSKAFAGCGRARLVVGKREGTDGRWWRFKVEKVNLLLARMHAYVTTCPPP